MTLNDNHCVRKWIEYYIRSTKENSISGCQRDYSNGSCYVYYLSSYIEARGNRGSSNMCPPKDNYQCSSKNVNVAQVT